MDLYYTVKQQYARSSPAHVLLIKTQLGNEQRIRSNCKNRSTEQADLWQGFRIHKDSSEVRQLRLSKSQFDANER